MSRNVTHLQHTGRPVVIVDPFSSGDEWAPAFAARGSGAVAILSSPGIQDAYRTHPLRPEDFSAVHLWSDSLVDRLRTLDPLCVLPGAESGVEIADHLSALLTPQYANTPALAGARRDKGLMQAAVAAAGLPVIRSLATDDEQQAQEWLHDSGLAGRPLVLKPPKSGGTDGVVLVEAGTDWRPAFRRLLGGINALGAVNEAVLIQEYVTGTEFAVDTVSYDGAHTLCGIARYSKARHGHRIALYDRVEFVPHDARAHDRLVGYVHEVLNALGIRWGAAHTEVIMTADGPRFVECGARLHGGGQPELARLGSGSSQVDRLADAFTSGGTMEGDYRQTRTVMSVFLSSHVEGTLENTAAMKACSGLPSHFRTAMARSDGDAVPLTTDLFSILGMVVLAHEQREQVMADYRAVQRFAEQLCIRPTETANTVGASRDR
ncbi:ATP-grasp domain-containing protein [Streptomyces sp. NPDC002536]